jgi:hypothetical protein
MYSDYRLSTVTGVVQHRFDSLPGATVAAIVREALLANARLEAQETRFDGAGTKSASDPRQAARDRDQARRDEMGATIAQQWRGADR